MIFFFGIRQKTKVPTINNNIIVQTIEVMSFDKVINSIFKCVLIKTKITITIIDILFLQLRCAPSRDCLERHYAYL